VFWTPDGVWHLGGGIYDGASTVDGIQTGARGPSTAFSSTHSDDVFLIAEGGFRLAEAGPFSGAMLSVGGWWHSGDFITFSGGSRDGVGGIYAVGEARLLTPTDVDLDDPEDLGGLWAFGQFGWAPVDVAEVGLQFGGGLAQYGTFADRPDDSVGVYVTWADFSDDPASGFVGDETVVEAYYDFALTPWCHIKPDLQFISNPSGDASIDDAWVGTLRVTIVF
jgi:porin